ncbi:MULTISPECIES: transporter substrate-binding domain-containing protein [Pseudomonas chlororaphis group]|uniref:transporter substrate-binding domain-containing protein n=1 Tax=Pseudomonas chlororaphis group TaxID=136842 RepID=UPI002097A118|nr:MULTISPECIES: transporter substrate-binding domain-containing protein [Pseudomonas chlororaphis group]MCO7580379.1 transporter substrate-binding domain-containing protein [Pseudomonas protegens]MCO7586504.1 transporter substrate-binding domain-containing protein [Pseudomonas chlororaphis]MCO7603537.1 transporter substrate-binding domain-containing protein [Pseudomonas chlororaphis]
MLLRALGLLTSLALLCNLPLAESSPLAPQVLFSQLNINHHDLSVSPEDWQWLRHKAELRVGVSVTESAPFSVHNEDHVLEGISADTTALVTQLLGLRATIVPFANDHDAQQALQAGRVDVINIHGGPRPREGVLYSNPYARERLALFKRSDQTQPLPNDLAGMRVAITNDHSAELQKRYPQANFQIHADHDQAIAAAAFGQADVYVDDLYSAYYRINRSFYGLVHFEGFVDLPTAGYSYAMRTDNPRLQRLINAALDAIGNDQLRSLARRWVGNSFLPGETPIGLTAEQTRWIQRHPVVRLIINDDLAPGAYFDSKGIFSGGIADLLEVISLSTGLRFEVVSGSGGFPQIIEAVQTGKADMALMTASPEREDYLRFSRPLLTSPFVLLSNVDQQDRLRNMVGKRIAVPTGHVAIEQLHRRYPESVVVEAGSSLDTMNLLYKGEADAALVSLPAARYYVERLFREELAINQVLDVGPTTVNLAMRRSDVELQSIIDKVLKGIAPDELNAISNRWRSPPGMSGQTWVDYEKTISKIIAGAALLLLLLIVWVIYLRRQIQARLKAERMLNDQLQFVETLTDCMPPPLYARDLDGRMLSCNRSYLNSLGLNAEQVLNKTVYELPPGSFESLPDFHGHYLQAMRDDQTIESVHAVTLQGKTVWIEHWVQPFRDSKGAIKGVICGWLDITEHRHLVQQLQEAKIQADEASRAKTSFLATMSHEIRTPMNAVVGILELALKRADSKPIDRASIQIAHTSATSLLELIGDILDIARIESGRLSLSPKRANLRELVESVARVFEGLARQKRLSLMLDIDSSINCDVLVDALRFKQILSNLISNAIKFTEEGSITVSISGLLESTSLLNVSLTVEDSGVGISAADQKRLFRPFAQADRNVQQAEGTGLGLVICRSLCEMMGGKVILTSTLGRGTRVDVEMRLQILEQLDAPQVPTVVQAKLRHRLQVLIVDDHQINRQVLHEQLNYLGHDVYEAENGQVAYQRWTEQPFDIVITDCHMPVMNGVDLARTIRRAEQIQGTETTVIIGLTADAQPEEIDQCIQAGMNDCLIKPLALDALDARLLALQPGAEFITFEDSQSEPPPIATEATQLIDLGHLETLVSSEPTKLQQILDALINSNREDSLALKEYLLQGDTSQLIELAHRIKGAARVVKAEQLVECCQQLEEVCNTPQATAKEYEEAVNQIAAAIEALEQALRNCQND